MNLRRRKPHVEVPNLRDIVATTLRHRSGRFTYRHGALDRIVSNAPASFAGVDKLIDYVTAAITAEEIPINRVVLTGWFDWFEHAHEMV